MNTAAPLGRPAKGKPTNYLTTSIPNQLRAWRRARRLSQSQAAPVLGVPLDTLQNWEQGRSRPRGLAVELLTTKLTTKGTK